MEKLMQYVWQHRLWPRQLLSTVDGKSVQILDPGRLNTDAGPDFFNAKVKIDGHLWAGDVEIHVRASDWHRHKHDGDPAYDSVILHVVDRDDTMIRRSNGEVIPQMCMPCSPTLSEDYQALTDRSTVDLPCASSLPEIPAIYLTDWLGALTYERLHTRAEHIESLMKLTSGDLEESCYIMLARSLGFGINGEPFERLARSLPLKFVGRHSDSQLSVEALLFGQSALPFPPNGRGNAYVDRLQGEYRFLAQKFGLRPLESPGWKMGRMRPANFPHRRIAYLAEMLNGGFRLRSEIIEIKSVEDARNIFDRQLSGYWTQHYHFADAGTASPMSGLSPNSIDLLIINLAAPVLFHHGLMTGSDKYMDKAIELLEALKPERNMIIELFGRGGITAGNAAMSQALVHLRRNYCEQRKCLYCRIGHRVLSACAVRR